MRKAERLFEIIQILRLARQPVTAAKIAETMEVGPRSIYRDIAALQAMRVPIEGERGIGYVLRPGFTLPPLMFSIEETEAIVLSLQLLQRTGDAALRTAARRIEAKIAGVLPGPMRGVLDAGTIYAWGSVAAPAGGIDLTLLREAIREERKIRMDYRDLEGRLTSRIVRPLALIYYSQATTIVAWCELRQAIRQFRCERIVDGEATDAFFRGEGERLRQLWIAGWEVNQPNQPAADRA